MDADARMILSGKAWRVAEIRYADDNRAYGDDDGYGVHVCGMSPEGRLTRFLCETGNTNVRTAGHITLDQEEALDFLHGTDLFSEELEIYRRLFGGSEEDFRARIKNGNCEDHQDILASLGLTGERMRLFALILTAPAFFVSNPFVVMFAGGRMATDDGDDARGGGATQRALSFGSRFGRSKELLNPDLVAAICRLPQEEAAEIVKDTLDLPVVKGFEFWREGRNSVALRGPASEDAFDIDFSRDASSVRTVRDMMASERRRAEEIQRTKKASLAAYMCFCQENRDRIHAKFPSMHVSRVTAELGKMWIELLDAQRARYETMAREVKVRTCCHD